MGTQMASEALAPDFRALFDSLPGLYVVLTPDFKIVAASEAYLRATMTRREAILNRPIFDVLGNMAQEPESPRIHQLRASLQRVLMYKGQDGMDIQKFEPDKPISPDRHLGVRYWVPVNSPVLGRDGEVAYIIHQLQDITGFLGLVEGGQGRPSLQLESPVSPALPEGQPRTHDPHEANWLLEKANQQLTRLSSELEGRVAERTAQLAEANGQLAAELAERKRLEHQLLHSQKLEAVRRLARGVAHDFNNLLTILQGYSELLLTQSAAGTPEREQLEEITRASEGAAVLTRQLLAFSRQQILEVKVLDLNAVVTEVASMLHRSIGEDIELITVLDKDSCRINADPGQIEQILLNLAVNARDAMPKGGKLTIETANVEVDAASARDHVSLKPGPYVMVAMSDTGIGMDLETQEHLFEPFFTTKAQGEGSGLGLSTVYGVVKQSGGSIGVHSAPGQGATFRIYLPRMAEAAEPVEAFSTASSEGRRLEGTESILLVEDEEAVRSLIRRSLQSKGYSVLEARLSSEALEIVQQAGPTIDLVLTDVVLPGMSGPELAGKIKGAQPDVKIVYMSGYADDMLVCHGMQEPGKHFIQKPFGADDLVRKIREVLDTAESQ